MSIEGPSQQPFSCCYTVLYALRSFYDKVKELAKKLFEYIASFFYSRSPKIKLPENIVLLAPKPESPIHIIIDLAREDSSLSTDALESIPEPEEAAKTPSPPATPVSISSAVERRLKQDSPDTIIREVLESMSATPPGEQIVITITPPETIHRISPTASLSSVDSSGWVIDPD